MNPPSRIPIVLGVTGHRDLLPTDEPRLRAAVAAELDRLRCTYGNTPLVLLSSLAEGADQLCAEMALASGARVTAPLPFPAPHYRRSSSFSSETSRSKLDTLLADRRVTSFVAPLPPGRAPDGDAAWERCLADASQRHACYSNAGGYVALHSHALIAVWDGELRGQAAGTAQVALYKLTGQPPANYPWPPSLFNWADSGPVFVVPALRARTATGSPSLGDAPYTLYPARSVEEVRQRSDRRRGRPAASAREPHETREAAQFADVCQRLDAFNREIAARPDTSTEASVASMLGEAAASLPIHAGLGPLAVIRAAAGRLARRGKALIWKLHVAVLGLMLCAATSFHLYAHPLDPNAHQHDVGLLITFLLLLTPTFGLVSFAHRKRLEPRYLDYRALAEALRVQFYWAVAGVDESVAGNYLQQFRNEISWTRSAVRAASPALHECHELVARQPSDVQRALLRAVGKHWLEVQKGQFQKEHRKLRSHNRLGRKAGIALALVGWGLALCLLLAGPLSRGLASHSAPAPEASETSAEQRASPVAGATPVPGARWGRLAREESKRSAASAGNAHAGPAAGWDPAHPLPWILILSGSLVVAGGLLIAFCERQLWEELDRQFERMALLYDRGIQALEGFLSADELDLEAAQRLLRDIGREALSENASWLVLRRARPLELMLG